ncbi:MAG: hypothetical protein AAFR87_35440 [Bacteroidota bacterium]
MILRSRYNYLSLHVAIFASFVGLSLIPFLLFTVASSVYRTEGFATEVIAMVIVATLLMGLAFYMCIQWIGKVPKIEITEGKISFRLFMLEKIYYVRDLEDVWPDGKVPLKILITQKKEGAKLKFRNGDVWYIYDEYYSNGWQIKCWIEDVLIKKGRLREFPASKTESLPEMNNLVKISNLGLLNNGSLVILGLAFFLSFILFSSSLLNFEKIVFVATALLLLLFLHRYIYSSFYIGEKHLFIKRQPQLSRPDFISYNQIKEAKVEIFQNPQIGYRPSVQKPAALRIIDKENKSYFYFSVGMKEKHWKDLRQKLQRKGVKVRWHEKL